ncbi:MAG: nitroreductase family protein [Cetobacterium sp.]|uniref:nitroreductase family protein n=1 Tax=Cetobacterium sp. TaxID=2071632 RepID=UPI002FCA7CF2
MDFLNRRTVRRYQDKKVEKIKIHEILRTALVSPSGKNTKPYEFLVVEDEATLKKLSHSKQMGATLIDGSPLSIVVLGNENSTTWVEDCSIACTMIQLKAFDLGLGSCWVQIKERKTSAGTDSEEYVRNLLGIPGYLRVLAIISIGYSDEIKPSHSESDMDFSKVHYENY